MRSLRPIAVVAGIIIVSLLFWNVSSEQTERVPTSTEALQQMVGPAPAQAAGSPYEMDVKPLTTVECGQCHFSVFQTIKNQGARHQIDCVRCHREYHVYSPRKKNYDKIMPDCAWCHKSATGGAFHGEHKTLTPCLNCHADPHKPLVIPMGDIEEVCGRCHAKEGDEIEKFPSKHTSDVSCSDCHADEHGFIPECSGCHESHSSAVEMGSKDCMTCHPVHKPSQIAYQKDTQSTICAGCHDTVYGQLQAKHTRHTPVACGECHPVHKEIPPCSKCHGEPHPKAMTEGMTCGDCHSIAHDLLM